MQRIDAFEKVTGKAQFADDLCLEGMLHAAPLHAAHPSAHITRLHTAQARQMPGVKEILTAKEVPGENLVGGIMQDQQIFAEERVLYHGDVLALVVATSRDAARAALTAIEVDYRVLPPILSPAEALKEGAPSVHPQRDSNIVASFRVRHGKIAPAFKESAHQVEARFHTSFIEHAYLEPESCVAIPEPDGSVTIRGGMQHPFTTQKFVAAATGLELARVRVIQTTLGGGFGGKDDTISVICARAAIGAIRTGRPVKITYTREESIRESYKRHPFELSYRSALDHHGRFTAMEVEITADAGPYCSTSPFVIWRPTVQCTGPYVVPNVKCDTRAVSTNNTFTGAMRGFGTPQQVFACESFIDMCAEKVGRSPEDFRRQHFLKQDSVTHTGQRLSQHHVSMTEVMDRALTRFGWKSEFKKCSRGKPRRDGLLFGVGFACSYRGASLGAEGNDFCSAIVTIEPDASVLLEVGVAENGQGLKTAMTAILCEELGISPDHVRYLDVDTSSVPDSGPTVASRGTLVGGNAVLKACAEIKQQMQPVLGFLIGPSEQGYHFHLGKIANAETGKTIRFVDAVFACHDRKLPLQATGTWMGPRVSWNERTGQGNAYFTYVYGCQACALTVSPKTGRVSALRVVAAHDVGKAINTQMALGQIFGGIAMGLGLALKERIVHQDGVIQNCNLNTYRIPRANEMPEMEAILVEHPDPAGPYGAKSLGEPTNELMGAAVANAIYYATNVRFFQTPITPGEILMSLGRSAPSTPRP